MKDSRVACYKCKHNKYFEYGGYKCAHPNMLHGNYEPVTGVCMIYPDCYKMRADEDKCGIEGKYFEPTFWAKLTRNNV